MTEKLNLLTVEAADRLRVSCRTLERWRYEGVGPAYRKLGGRVVYPLASIQRFEELGDVGGGA